MTETMTDDETVWSWPGALAEALAAPAHTRPIVALLMLTDGKSDMEVPVEDMATFLGVKESTVRSLLPKLEDAGWVRRIPGLSPSGRPVLRYVTGRTVR